MDFLVCIAMEGHVRDVLNETEAWNIKHNLVGTFHCKSCLTAFSMDECNNFLMDHQFTNKSNNYAFEMNVHLAQPLQSRYSLICDGLHGLHIVYMFQHPLAHEIYIYIYN